MSKPNANQTSAKQYRKKPVVIEAIQLHDISKHSFAENDVIFNWFADSNIDVVYNKDGTVAIGTLEGIMEASVGDFIIKGVKGEMYPCKPDIFALTYEEVE